MLNNEKKNLSQYPLKSFDWPWMESQQQPPYSVWAHEQSGSGGYSDFIFKYAARELFDITDPQLVYKNLRNPDFREVILERDGKLLLRFAIANGFRNIQNLVQKLKRSKSTYHYVEVMACPSGCLNGGAQIRPDAGMTGRDLTSQLDVMYKNLPQSLLDNDGKRDAMYVYANYLDGQYSDKAKSLLHTSYHAVEKMNTALNIKW